MATITQAIREEVPNAWAFPPTFHWFIWSYTLHITKSIYTSYNFVNSI